MRLRKALLLFGILPFVAWRAQAGHEAARPSVLLGHDPPPITEKNQWVFDLRWDKGDLYLLAVRKVELPSPMTTPRAMGRFALELTDGPIVVERVRFDFPGMAVPDEEGGISMTAHMRTRIGVFFPVTTRGTKLELLDRASNQRYAMPWPPHEGLFQTDAGMAPAPSDGG